MKGYRILVMLAVTVSLLRVDAAGASVVPEARNYWLYEVNTGTVMAEHRSEERVAAASLSKLMTCLLTLEALDRGELKWDQGITVPSDFVNPGGSSMDLKPGETATVRELVGGLMIVSANDAAQVLAMTLAGSEGAFAERMNERARSLGMTGTHYRNASGLPLPEGENTTTARDVGRLSAELLRQYGDRMLPITSQRSFRRPATGYVKAATNSLIFRDAGVDGLKTGHTDQAGYCLSATRLFEGKEGHRAIAVVMGAQGIGPRDDGAERLLEWGDSHFTVRRIVETEELMNLGLWKDLKKRRILGRAEKPVARFLPDDAPVTVTLLPELPETLPLHRGDPVGSLEVRYADGSRETVRVLSETELAGLDLGERLELLMKDLGRWFRSIGGA